MNASVTLPNPFTPMAFIPPPLAMEITNQNYAAVGSLAVLLWDIILHLPQDFKLARYGINKWFVIYGIARLASFAYLLGYVVVMTAPVGNCDYLRKISILYPFTSPLAILPFLIRVFAIYDNNIFVVTFFSATWLSVLAACIMVPIDAFSVNIGTTGYCLDLEKKMAYEIGLFCPFIHDTLIFLATSWGFMKFSYSDATLKNGINVMVLGKQLPAFSKSILRDGQFYYLVTLILNLVFIVLFFLPKPIIMPCTVGFVLLNTMASHVYRNMRLGFYKDYSITSSVINNAVQRPVQSARHYGDIVFENPISTKSLGAGKDLEAGNIAETSEEDKVGGGQ